MNQIILELSHLGVIDRTGLMEPSQQLNLQMAELLYKRDLQQQLPGVALPQHLFEVMQLVNQAGEVHLMVEIHPAAQQLFNQHLNSGQSIAISDAYKAMQEGPGHSWGWIGGAMPVLYVTVPFASCLD